MEIITGETPDISDYFYFGFYGWVIYKSNAGVEPTNYNFGLECHTALVKVCPIGSYQLQAYQNLVVLSKKSQIFKNKHMNGRNLLENLMLF